MSLSLAQVAQKHSECRVMDNNFQIKKTLRQWEAGQVTYQRQLWWTPDPLHHERHLAVGQDQLAVGQSPKHHEWENESYLATRQANLQLARQQLHHTQYSNRTAGQKRHTLSWCRRKIVSAGIPSNHTGFLGNILGFFKSYWHTEDFIF